MNDFSRGFWHGYQFAAGVACFLFVVWLAGEVLAIVVNLFMDIFAYNSNLPWHRRSYPNMPEPDPCPICGWKPAVWIPHTVVVHLPDGTHDTKTKEVY